MAKDKTAPGDKKFGTFAGVFTPSLLTILGVIMYQRMGWLVGHAGMVGAIIIVLLAHVIAVTTGLSVASIATSRTVRTGGAYHIISRSLGLPLGGAIGLGLYVAMSLAVALYLIGFAENFVQVVGLDQVLPAQLARQGTALLFCVLLTAVAFVSTSLAMRMQYIVLACVAGSLISFFLGRGATAPTEVALWPGPGAASLETAFAVFFPAVTGFTSGVAMAGDLRKPSKSIPIGTMVAIGVAMVVYLVLPVFLAFQVDTRTLRTDMNVWMSVSVFSPLVVAGIWGATLSSALASILGAPRVLQALAGDKVVPRLLGKGHGAANEPRVAMVLTGFIAAGGIAIGDLDAVAPIISMCFLTCYGVICLACGLERWADSPSFRPQFKVPAWISLTGAVACFAVMFKLQMVAMFAAMGIMGVIYLLLQRRQFRLTAGDTWEGVWSALVRRGLIKLHRARVDARNWRPNVLVFAGTTIQRPHLIHLGEWIVGQGGIVTNHMIVEGDLQRDRDRASAMHHDQDVLLARDFPTVLFRHMVAPSVYEGIRSLAFASGLAGMEPNTVLLGWARRSEDPAGFATLLREVVLMDRNLLVLAHDEARGYGLHNRIDVWWGGKEYNWSLMVLVASLLKASDQWMKTKVRLLVVVDTAEEVPHAKARLDSVLEGAKMTAETKVLCKATPEQPPFELIRQESQDADLTMLGLREPDEGEGEAFISRVDGMVQGLGTVLLVRASSRFEGTRVLFEQGD